MPVKTHMKALGTHDVPETISLDGQSFRLQHVYKHTFATAVALYERSGDRVVCKFHRKAPFFGIPLGWLGRLWATYEAAALRKAEGLEGVPRLRGKVGRWGVARDYVAGTPLRRRAKVDESFFPRLLSLLHGIHERGMAYVDLEKPENILLGDDGRPYLIDFQTAFNVPRRFLGQTAPVRFLRRLAQRGDIYHAMKHFRRMRPDLLTPRQLARARHRPWPVRLGNLLVKPVKMVRRKVLAKRRC